MKTTKILFHVCWLSAVYFLLLALNSYVIKSQFILIGIVKEIFTIPIIIAQLVICVWSLYSWVKDDFNIKGYILLTFLISLGNSIAVIWTFFY